MRRIDQKNKINQKLKRKINSYKSMNDADIPFIVSNELNFPFLINLGRTQENHFKHHRVLTSMKRRT
jgi:hypothetical protein